MTRTYENNKTLLICLLIALIFHLFLFLSLFIKFDHSQAEEKNLIQPNKLKELFKKDVSSLKPNSGPVVFYKEEEKKENTPDTRLTPKKAENLKPEEPIKSEVKKEFEKAEKLLKPVEIDKKPSSLKEKAQIIEEKSKKIKQQIDQAKLENKKNEAQKSTIENAQKLIQSDNTKALPKLSSLAKGFVNYMNEEGNNQFIHRQGTSDKIDPHEAKLISYYNKIISFFHKAARPQMNKFNQIIDAFLSSNSAAIKIEVGIKLIINKDGSLNDIILMNKSGFNAYDDYIINTFYNSAPFPPVPDHLSKDELVFPIRIFTPLDRPNFSLRIG